MVTFVALYRRASLPSAQLVAVVTDPQLVAHVAGALLRERQEPAGHPAVAALAAPSVPGWMRQSSPPKLL